MRSLKGKFFIQSDPDEPTIAIGEVIDANDEFILVKHDSNPKYQPSINALHVFSLTHDVSETHGNFTPLWMFFDTREEVNDYIDRVMNDNDGKDGDNDHTNNIIPMNNKKGH